MADHIVSWSHSSLGNFEKCKFLAKLKHLDRIPEPARELPPGKTEFANDRGTRIHDHAEGFVNGTRPAQIAEMREFAVEFDHLRHLFTKGMVSLEGEWAVDKNWEPTDWNGEWVVVDRPTKAETAKAKLTTHPALLKYGKHDDLIYVDSTVLVWVSAWHRSKVDAIVIPDPEQAIVIDYKSGKKFGNEIKHAEQTQLYALNAILRFPKIELVTTELWYLDAKELTRATFTRAQILRFKPGFNARGKAMTTATEFPPNPNVYSCQFCQYGPWNGGQCKVGVQRR